MHRNSYMEINTNNISNNVNKIINHYNNYKYYFGVVKANCYGFGINICDHLIKSGINYFAVATLDEALNIRKMHKDIPILCLGIINTNYIDLCIKNNITITVSNIDYVYDLVKRNNKNLKVHIKINSGMNRLGFDNKKEINKTYNILKDNNIFIEGIYSHIYNACNKKDTLNQYKRFENLISDLNINDIPIVHVNASEALTLYDKKDYMNGCRLGIIMYGITERKDLELLSAFKLCSEVIQINNVKKGQTVGYNGIYKCDKDELIAVVSIGYADGIIRKNTGRYVYINNKKYIIVGNICMDMLFVKVDKNVKVGDKVLLIKDNNHLKYISKYLDTIPYEVICSISERIERKYIF